MVPDDLHQLEFHISVELRRLRNGLELAREVTSNNEEERGLALAIELISEAKERLYSASFAMRTGAHLVSADEQRKLIKRMLWKQGRPALTRRP